MKKKMYLPVAGLAALGLTLAAPAAAFAQSPAPATYQAMLQPVPLNGANSASGTLTLKLSGDAATISEQVSGLAATFKGAPYPHVQHIHGGAMGACPAASADTNNDGVISTTEGAPAYGGILTTLSVSGGTTPASGTDTTIAPGGASFNYSRTITVDQATLTAIKDHTAVIVVHGLDPATAAPAATSKKSDLVPSLPLAATSPALCGVLTAMPSGAAGTGGGSTAGTQDLGLFGLGGALVLGGAGTLFYRRRRAA
jgi:hypothetical protein